MRKEQEEEAPKGIWRLSRSEDEDEEEEEDGRRGGRRGRRSRRKGKGGRQKEGHEKVRDRIRQRLR